MYLFPYPSGSPPDLLINSRIDSPKNDFRHLPARSAP